MAIPTALNGQITDAVTQSGVQVLGSSAPVALGSLFQSTAHAMALAAHNATIAQQQGAITAQASTTAGVTMMYAALGISAKQP